MPVLVGSAVIVIVALICVESSNHRRPRATTKRTTRINASSLAGWGMFVRASRCFSQGEEDSVSNPNAREVRPNGAGGWEVINLGGKQRSGTFTTQSAAVARAKQILSRNGGGELRVAGRDGAIRDATTVPPGNDPQSSKG